MHSHSPFYALTFPNYRLFFYGQSVSVAGTWMQIVAQNWFVWRLTGSPQWLGVVNGVSIIPTVCFTIWGGQLADRYSRRSILLWTQFCAMLLAFLLAALASNLWLTPKAWHIAVIAALASAVNAFNLPAQQAFVNDLIEDKNALRNAIALNSLRFNLARFVGPMLAGYVLVRSGEALCFLLNAFSFIAVILSLWFMRLPVFVPSIRSRAIGEGFRYLAERPRVLRMVFLVGAGALFVWSAATLFPVFATHLGVGKRGYSQMTSANGVGAMTAGFALATFSRTASHTLRIYGGATLFGLSLIAFSFAPSHALALFCLACSGFGMITCAISCNTAVQEEVPDALRGRVMAVYSLAFQGLMPLGGLLVGALAERTGAVFALRLNATLFLVVTAVLGTWHYRDRSVENGGEEPQR